MTQSRAQKITGLVVNRFTNIDRRYYDKLKATLYNCIRFGPLSQNINNHINYKEHLLGKINHVARLNVNKGLKLKKLFNEINFIES